MYQFETQLRVRYAETDQMGIVYYGNYAMYCEVARVDTMRSLGVSYRALEENGVMLPVLDYSTKFIRPAKYDDLITIRVTIPEMPATRIKFLYEMFNEEGTLLNKAETTLVFVDIAKNRPCLMPDYMAEKFAPYFSKEEKV